MSTPQYPTTPPTWPGQPTQPEQNPAPQGPGAPSQAGGQPGYPTQGAGPSPTPPPGDPTAVIGRRLLAYLIDGLLMSALFTVLVLIAGEKYDVAGFDGSGLEVDWRLGEQLVGLRFGDTAYIATESAFWAVTLGLLVVFLFFRIVLEGSTGATPGKAVAGVRTVRRDGQAPGIGSAIIRTVCWLFDGFPYFLPIVGSVVLLADSKTHRRIGDRLADTYVVGVPYAGMPLQLAGQTVPVPGVPGYVPTPTWPATGASDGAPGATALGSGTGTGTATDTSAAGPAQADDPTKPRWDPERKAYLQWHPRRRVWLQWNDTDKQWKVLG